MTLRYIKSNLSHFTAFHTIVCISAIKNFECHLCLKRFARRDKLMRHIQEVHEGILIKMISCNHFLTRINWLWNFITFATRINHSLIISSKVVYLGKKWLRFVVINLSWILFPFCCFASKFGLLCIDCGGFMFCVYLAEIS